MDIQTHHSPTAAELVEEALSGAADGAIISVKATIEAVRERGSYLHETDCELVAMIVFEATVHSLFVAFDLRE